MNGAESLVSTLVDEGVDICFANPGTSEMHFLAALENPRMRSVLCLFEGVATGAADGWYRMRRAPAATLLHLGPGLANGLANIHNAKRAGSGMVNIIGEHATAHLKYDAPLASDIEGLARPLSHWVRRTISPNTLAGDAVAAVEQASARPGKIATLILPGDTSWGDVASPPGSFARSGVPVAQAPDVAAVERVASILRSGEPAFIILAGNACFGPALDWAGKVAAKTGCRIGTQFFTSRIARGAGRTPLERLPYAVPQAVEFLKDFKHIITVETGEPVAFFSYPGKPSLLKQPGAHVHRLAAADEDSALALEMLAEALGARDTVSIRQTLQEKGVPTGALNPLSIAHALASAMPEDAILVDESLTTGRETMGHTAGAVAHDIIQNMGGSIGYGTPVATGAALACPHRRVVCMVGDGSAMYTIQSLWTQAREQLNVTTIIFANNSYQILKAEFANMGFGAPGPQALAMIDIDRPSIDWLAMGKSMGVQAVSVNTADEFFHAMMRCNAMPGPSLIEVRL
ncbi:acetolactate synthase large subunit [Nitrospirillum iridis]|uniref:Acetolactate synthase-1/2/3 large subunit n=1 Tax=Nitrospirillum iridis TaxID=765888 RepID=A0A7X0B4I6_9PROT|nr:acetolactate synthase large subunit [Nitrospirillum iridis]MBB6255257.1 acetolactate synthase-1/2/3 large subunit [Nitrospirillum iridis]